MLNAFLAIFVTIINIFCFNYMRMNYKHFVQLYILYFYNKNQNNISYAMRIFKTFLLPTKLISII